MAPQKHPYAPTRTWDPNPKATRAEYEHLRASTDFLTVLTAARSEFSDDHLDIDALAQPGLASLDATGLTPAEVTAATGRLHSSRTLLVQALSARRKLHVVEVNMRSTLASFVRDNPTALGELGGLDLHDLRALHRELTDVSGRLTDVEPEFHEELLAKVSEDVPDLGVSSLTDLARRLLEVRDEFSTDRVRRLSQLDLLRHHDTAGTRLPGDLARAYASLWESSLAHQALLLCTQFRHGEDFMGLCVHPDLPVYQVPLALALTLDRNRKEVLSLDGVSSAEKETLLTLLGTDAYPTLESALMAARAL